jgi:GDSL-like lipase/acylhydrolase family protein
MRLRLATSVLLVVGAPLLLYSVRSSPDSELVVEPSAAESRAAEPRAVEPKAAEPKAAEPKAAETGAADQSATDRRATEGESERPSGRVRYPYGALHSPMSKDVVAKLKAVLASSKGRPGVVAKVGDSLTVNSYFLGCFTGNDVRLGDYADLEPTRAFFAATPADPTHSSFERTTLAAKVCWSSTAVVSGSPCPLEQEITAIQPAFAVVLIGTNDTFPAGPERLDAKLLRIVDIALGRGVIPILTTLPQRRDTTEARLLVPEMNAVVRAIAQERQVPLIDLFASLVDIPRNGLGKDGIHLATYSEGISRGCWFDHRALQKGVNRRNLLTLAALDRARRFLIESEAPEADPPAIEGEGTWLSPYEIDALPFVDDRDPSKTGVSERATYEGSAADDGGPEIVYRLDITERTALRARIFHAPGADMDIHLLDGVGRSAHCIETADKALDVTLDPGTYGLAIDALVRRGGASLPGDYRLTVVRAR